MAQAAGNRAAVGQTCRRGNRLSRGMRNVLLTQSGYRLSRGRTVMNTASTNIETVLALADVRGLIQVFVCTPTHT